MTVYVDDVRIRATVGRYRDRQWCHLVSDHLDTAELHEFAHRIGLRRAWFQPGKTVAGRELDPVRDHYDVTEAMRQAAVAAGATEIDLHQFSELLTRKRAAHQAQQAKTSAREG